MAKARQAPRRRRPGRPEARTVSATAVAGAVLVGLAPAVVVPGALNRFVFGKLVVFAVACCYAFVTPSLGRLPRRWRAVVIAAGGILLLAALLSAAPFASVFGRAPRFEGLFVLTTYVLSAAAGARLLGGEPEPRRVAGFLAGLATAVAAVGLVAVLETAGLRPLATNVARPGSLLGNASDEGAFAVIALGPLLCVGVARRHVWLLAAAGVAAMTAVLSLSRGALVGLFAELLVLGLLVGGRRWRAGIAAGAVACAALALAVPASRHRLFDQSPLSGATQRGRVLLYDETMHLLASHPVLGVGPSGFEAAIPRWHDQRWQRDVGPANPPDSPHNVVLQAAAAGGPALALLAIGAFVALLYDGRRRLRDPATSPATRSLVSGGICALVGYAVVLMVHLTSPGPTLLAAALAGVVVAEPVGVARGSRRWKAVALPVVAAALVVVFVAASVSEVVLRHAISDVAARRYTAANGAFSAAEVLRPWDADLPAEALHAFAEQTLTADPAAALPGRRWVGRTLDHLRGDPQVRVDAAAIAEGDRDFGEALRLLDAALRDDPWDPVVLLRRGVVHGERGELTAAEADFQSVIRLQPDSPDPWRDLAVVYRLEHRTAAATAAELRARQLSTR